MKKKRLFLWILLALVIVPVVLTGIVAAIGVTRSPFKGTEGASRCYDSTTGTRCTPGKPVTLPNGQSIVRDAMHIIDFQTDDPRFTGHIEVSFTTYPSTPNGTTITGPFRFYPSTVKGYWDGAVAATLSGGSVHSQFYAIGRGALAGHVLSGTNTNGLIQGEITSLK
jgi:hypothetical protein